ncbi:MAG TPA: hypothetical protein VGZ69_01255 [Candidatus Rhabdochlamydia sp.]|jgi:hypothetical protein|nr:hypothetical protein [Candidatus Rhabdochlamydia sp.]
MFPLGIGLMSTSSKYWLQEKQNKELRRSITVRNDLNKLEQASSLRGKTNIKETKANCCIKSFTCFSNIFKK